LACTALFLAGRTLVGCWPRQACSQLQPVLYNLKLAGYLPKSQKSMPTSTNTLMAHHHESLVKSSTTPIHLFLVGLEAKPFSIPPLASGSSSQEPLFRGSRYGYNTEAAPNSGIQLDSIHAQAETHEKPHASKIASNLALTRSRGVFRIATGIL
jgi:hypothetical protein